MGAELEGRLDFGEHDYEALHHPVEHGVAGGQTGYHERARQPDIPLSRGRCDAFFSHFC